ncbi:MAG: DUF4349 domain-containing protein [Turneriella sp.]|nr:DUF4349 domain-containing protein [Turneriella sp.]
MVKGGISQFSRFLPLLLFFALGATACNTGKHALRESSGESFGASHSPSPPPQATDGTTAATGGAQGESSGEYRPPASPLLIYNSSISLEATDDDIKKISGQVIDKAKGFGGYLSQRSSNSLTVRVPAKEFYPLNDFIKSLAAVKYENATAQDVTMQYTDLKIRLDVQMKMLVRYQDLLKKANSVKDAVEVERELSRITERVEQLKGQIRYYDSQIGFSTIVVNFQAPYTAFSKETKPGPLGWVFYGLYVGVKWLFVWD